MTSVEFGGGEGAEGALPVRLSNRVHHLRLLKCACSDREREREREREATVKIQEKRIIYTAKRIGDLEGGVDLMMGKVGVMLTI